MGGFCEEVKVTAHRGAPLPPHQKNETKQNTAGYVATQVVRVGKGSDYIHSFLFIRTCYFFLRFDVPISKAI